MKEKKKYPITTKQLEQLMKDLQEVLNEVAAPVSGKEKRNYVYALLRMFPLIHYQGYRAENTEFLRDGLLNPPEDVYLVDVRTRKKYFRLVIASRKQTEFYGRFCGYEPREHELAAAKSTENLKEVKPYVERLLEKLREKNPLSDKYFEPSKIMFVNTYTKEEFEKAVNEAIAKLEFPTDNNTENGKIVSLALVRLMNEWFNVRCVWHLRIYLDSFHGTVEGGFRQTFSFDNYWYEIAFEYVKDGFTTISGKPYNYDENSIAGKDLYNDWQEEAIEKYKDEIEKVYEFLKKDISSAFGLE